MICPRCSHNQLRRRGMRCETCSYQFVLDPKQHPYCADRRFAHWIDAASDNGSRWYTPRQLHSVIFGRRNRSVLRRYVQSSGSSRIELTVNAVERWRLTGRDVRTLIEKPALEGVPDPSWPEPDLHDYGAEGLLIVDDPLAVDLLVRNGAHLRTKVVIAAGNGYPTRVTSRIRSTVAARPDLPIFLLHNSEPTAAAALEQAARARFGISQHPILDLGLPPDASRRIRALSWGRRVSRLPIDSLPHRWLDEGLTSAIAARIPLVGLVERRDDGFADLLWWGGGDDDFG